MADFTFEITETFGKLPENSLASGCLRLLNCEQFTNLQKRECNILIKTIDYDKIYG